MPNQTAAFIEIDSSLDYELVTIDNETKNRCKKSSGYHTRDITPKRGTRPGNQRSSKEKSLRWQAIGATVSDLTDPGIEPMTSRANRAVFN